MISKINDGLDWAAVVQEGILLQVHSLYKLLKPIWAIYIQIILKLNVAVHPLNSQEILNSFPDPMVKQRVVNKRSSDTVSEMLFWEDNTCHLKSCKWIQDCMQSNQKLSWCLTRRDLKVG